MGFQEQFLIKAITGIRPPHMCGGFNLFTTLAIVGHSSFLYPDKPRFLGCHIFFSCQFFKNRHQLFSVAKGQSGQIRIPGREAAAGADDVLIF